MPYRYSMKGYEKEKMARSVGLSLPISLKHSIEVCNLLRGKEITRARKILSDIINMRKAVPYRRFHRDLSHKDEAGPGRFPVKTATEIKKIIETCVSNAQFKGLSTSNLLIAHISAQHGPKAWHYGRQRRRMFKRTHIEVVLVESAKEKRDKARAPEKQKQKEAAPAKGQADTKDKPEPKKQAEPAEQKAAPVKKKEKPAQKAPAKRQRPKKESQDLAAPGKETQND